MKIYVKFEIPLTLSEFLIKFFSDLDYGIGSAVETYSNKECTNFQCRAGRLRSIDDMLDCVQTYYPETTIKDLMHELLTLNLIKNNKRLYLYMSNCSTISRIRIYWYEAQDYTNINCNKYDSKWSWIELLAMLNIQSVYTSLLIDQIKNYINTHKNETLQNTQLC